MSERPNRDEGRARIILNPQGAPEGGGTAVKMYTDGLSAGDAAELYRRDPELLRTELIRQMIGKTKGLRFRIVRRLMKMELDRFQCDGCGAQFPLESTDFSRWRYIDGRDYCDMASCSYGACQKDTPGALCGHRRAASDPGYYQVCHLPPKHSGECAFFGAAEFIPHTEAEECGAEIDHDRVCRRRVNHTGEHAPFTH